MGRGKVYFCLPLSTLAKRYTHPTIQIIFQKKIHICILRKTLHFSLHTVKRLSQVSADRKKKKLAVKSANS